MRVQCAGLLALAFGASGLRKEAESLDSQIGAHSASNAEASRGFAMDTMKSLAGQKITPQVLKILEDVKAELAGSVSEAIKQDHLSAQQEIARLVGELTASTSAAVKASVMAHGAHQAWSSCVAEEQSFLKKHEALVALVATQETDKATKFAKALKLAPFSAKTTKMGLVCDISAKGNCDAEIQKLQEAAKAQIAQVNNDAATARAAYQAALAEFNKAKELLANTEKERDAMQDTYQTKRSSCMTAKGKRDNQVDNFGASFKAKCIDGQAWYDRKAQIEQAQGTEWSDPDRRTEWSSTQSTICMINAFAKDHSLTSAEISTCTASINYDKDVGKMNYMESDVDALLTEKKFTCKETQFSFEGDWTVPTSEAPTSEQYQKKDSRVVCVNLEANNPIASCSA